MIALTCLFVVLGVIAVLADRWGVDSRVESDDPRRPVYPVGIS
jgi:hypothetical protein